MGDNKIRYLDHVFGEEDDIKKGNCYLVGTLLGDSLSINTRNLTWRVTIPH